MKKKAHKACLSCLWKEEYFHLEVYFPSQRKEVLVEMSVWLVLSGLFILIVILTFLYIIKTIIKQKKLSEIKNDFINNMTHEFKTPISTISLAAEVLLHTGAESAPDRIKKYSKKLLACEKSLGGPCGMNVIAKTPRSPKSTVHSNNRGPARLISHSWCPIICGIGFLLLFRVDFAGSQVSLGFRKPSSAQPENRRDKKTVNKIIRNLFMTIKFRG